MSVSGPYDTILQGYLHKQSQHLKIWKIRYFVLTRQSLLYAKKSGKKLRECVLVRDLQVIDDQNTVEHAGNFALELRSPTHKVFVSAATESERMKWAIAIRSLQQSQSDRTSQTVSGAVLLRNASDSFLNALSFPMLQAKNYHQFTPGKRRRVSRERREERRRQRLAKMKKPFSEIWVEDILTLPRQGDARPDPALVEALCFAGIPKEIRGRAWAWLLGNHMQINEELFNICKSRAQAVRLEITMKREADTTGILGELIASSIASSARSSSSNNTSPVTARSSAETPAMVDEQADRATEFHDDPMVPKQHNLLINAMGIAEKLVTHGERSIRLVNIDMPRTFGHHAMFQAGAEGTERTTEVLEAYCCYRPDLGYVQGMSYLAAALCFHMDSFTAFKALVALMSTSLLFDMFRLEEKRTFHYISIFNQILEYELPRVSAHFQDVGIDAQMYAVDWALTLFTRSLPLPLALRLWDCYMTVGTSFFFQASIGLLALYEDVLVTMEPEDITKFLHNFPPNTSTRDLFEAIESVALSSQEIEGLLAGGQLWSPDAARTIPVTYPVTY